MPFLQDIIHKVEFGGSKVFRTVVTVLALLGALFLYDWRAFRNMASLEAMDAAQLARNIAEGNGYNTLFVRPFSIYLLERHEAVSHGVSAEFAFKYPTAARLNQRLRDSTRGDLTWTNTVLDAF